MTDRIRAPLAFPARRTVIHTEALTWLAAHPAAPGTSVITSLPDVSEVPEQGGLVGWRAWFTEAARQVLGWIPPDGVAIFYQSDIRQGGVWIDKSYLVQRAAEAAGAHLLWHRIVCRKPPGTVSMGRATYSHLLCFAFQAEPTPRHGGPDVLPDAGPMPWPRAMGQAACRLACRYLRDETPTRLVVDPFCGQGSVLAVANDFGFEALGLDLSIRRCRAAWGLNFPRDAGGSSR